MSQPKLHVAFFTAFVNTIMAKIQGMVKYECNQLLKFFTNMLRQNFIHFYKELHAVFRLAPGIKKNAVYLSNLAL